MSYANPDALVETDWLAAHLDAPDVRVVDGSWHMPQLGRDPRAEFEAAHIPGAVFFDIDDISEKSSDLPHMLPSAEKFASRVRKLGLGDGSRIIVYDATGMGSAARVWWTFRVFGHDDVAVLNGGLAKWVGEGRPADSGMPQPTERHLSARLDNTLVRTIDQMRSNIGSAREQVLDARSRGRFDATEAEPREGMRGGHIPGSLSQPFGEVFDPETKTVKSAEALRALFSDSGITGDRPIITSCGSGISACNLALGLYLIGRRDVSVYDGSWSEWGGRDDTPIDS